MRLDANVLLVGLLGLLALLGAIGITAAIAAGAPTRHAAGAGRERLRIAGTELVAAATADRASDLGWHNSGLPIVAWPIDEPDAIGLTENAARVQHLGEIEEQVEAILALLLPNGSSGL
jgi:hypothetical protein